MLLFSTVLNINESVQVDDFIRLVLEWNDTSIRVENKVPDIDWQGERTVRYGSDKLSLEFMEYQEKGIFAVRHEKITDDGVVWDSDFIVDFHRFQIAIQLDRTYSEDALTMNAEFSTPHFITLLIEHGYVKNDDDIPVLRMPVFISDDDLEFCKKALTVGNNYELPIVYVSKTADNKDPLSVSWLASRLKGAAHILVEADVAQCAQIRAFCGKSEEPYGAVWIFYPSEAIRCRKYYYHSIAGDEKLRLEKVIRNVIQYGIAQRKDRLLTWNGVMSAMLNAQLKHQISIRAAAEIAKQEAEDEVEKVYEAFDEDLKTLQEKVAELTKANEALQYENQGLRAKYGDAAAPLLYLGDEEDFYQGEIRDMVLSTLDEALSATEKATRKADVLEDILDNNPYYHLSEERKKKVKTLFKGYKNLTGAMRQELLSLGLEITEAGKHYKLTYHGDQRYMVTVGKTPSDNRSGDNNAAIINKTML